jgi:3-oxoacyl-[acyl-carrier protein] reductase
LDLELAGRTGLVTGASSGIGRAIALTLGREGVRLAITGRRSANLEEVSREIAAAGGPPAVVIAADALDATYPEHVASRAIGTKSLFTS